MLACLASQPNFLPLLLPFSSLCPIENVRENDALFTPISATSSEDEDDDAGIVQSCATVELAPSNALSP